MKQKSVDKLLEIFKSFGSEINFATGEIISSKKFITSKVYLIKSGNARLITKINGKLISVLKLSKGDSIGIASLMGGKPIEEVRAANELVVYGLEDKKFLEIYKQNLDIKYFCDNYIWEAEKLSILKQFPKLNKKSLLISTNLLEVIHKNINLIIPDESNITNSLKNEERLFFNYFSDDYEIWSEIKSFSQVAKLLQKQNNFPLRIISVSKNIENIKVEEINQKIYLKNKKFDLQVRPSNISIPLETNIYKKEKDKKLFVPAKGNLEEALVCFEIIAKLMHFPFKKNL